MTTTPDLAAELWAAADPASPDTAVYVRWASEWYGVRRGLAVVRDRTSGSWHLVIYQAEPEYQCEATDYGSDRIDAELAAADLLDEHALREDLEAEGSQDVPLPIVEITTEHLRREALRIRLRRRTVALGNAVRAAFAEGLLGRGEGYEMTVAKLGEHLGVRRPFLYKVRDGEAWAEDVRPLETDA